MENELKEKIEELEKVVKAQGELLDLALKYCKVCNEKSDLIDEKVNSLHNFVTEAVKMLSRNN